MTTKIIINTRLKQLKIAQLYPRLKKKFIDQYIKV